LALDLLLDVDHGGFAELTTAVRILVMHKFRQCAGVLNASVPEGSIFVN
jgi:hypothetical protein